jgi:hypothetical protein
MDFYQLFYFYDIVFSLVKKQSWEPYARSQIKTLELDLGESQKLGPN